MRAENRERTGAALDQPSPLTRLSELPLGTEAVIAAVESDDAIGQRLRDLGFRPGAEVRCERRAPLGEPRVYAILGTRVCLRPAEAKRIQVRTR